MDGELKAEHFVLEGPDRLVVDIDGLTMSAGLERLISQVRPNDPYIRSVRVAQNRPDVIRLVIDLKQAIAPQVFTLKPIGEYKYRLVLDLYPKVAQDPLLAIMGNTDTDPLAEVLENLARNTVPDVDIPSVQGQRLPPVARQPNTPPDPPPSVARPNTARPNAARPNAARPAPAQPGSARPILIALDPGHGGEDPGAIGRNGTKEKDIVLLIAKRLKRLIDAQPGMQAYLTRDNDFFVPLQVRVQKARRIKADLFISIHADAWIKPTARG